MDELLKNTVDKAIEFQSSVNPLIEGLLKTFVDKYGNEELARKYIGLVLNGKTKQANILLKKLENG